MKNQEIKKLVKGIINNNGICDYCDKQRIEYGIINGSYWYYCHNCKKAISKDEISTINQRLEYLRQEIRAERISYAEIAELQSLVEHINPSDTELLEWAGVPEAMGEQQFKKAVKSEEVKKDHTKTTLGELLSSNSDGIRRCAISILKQIQKK